MKDLSSLCGDIGTALLGGESSSAGNTINYPVTTVGAAPGSEPVNHVSPESPQSHTDQPALVVSGEGEDIRKPKYGNGPTSTSATWEKV